MTWWLREGYLIHSLWVCRRQNKKRRKRRKENRLPEYPDHVNAFFPPQRWYCMSECEHVKVYCYLPWGISASVLVIQLCENKHLAVDFWERLFFCVKSLRVGFALKISPVHCKITTRQQEPWSVIWWNSSWIMYSESLYLYQSNQFR